jgi:hypothetical protein
MNTPGSTTGNRPAPGAWRPDWTILVIMAIAVVFIAGAWSMNLHARRFPLLAGGLCLALGFLELAGSYLRFRADRAAGRLKPRPPTDWADIREFAILAAWLFGSVLSIYVLGILGTAFVSTAVYHRVIDKRSVPVSILIGAVIAAFLWVSFSYLAGFHLYEGMLPISGLF